MKFQSNEMTSGRYQSSCKTAASGILGVGVVQRRHESAPEAALNHLHGSQHNFLDDAALLFRGVLLSPMCSI